MEPSPASTRQQISTTYAASSHLPSPTLLTIPKEIRLEIIRYCLRIERNDESSWFLDSTRDREFGRLVADLKNRDLASSSPFSSPAQLSGAVAPRTAYYTLHPKLLRICKLLLFEGRMVLYKENQWIVVRQSRQLLNQPMAMTAFEFAGLSNDYTTDIGKYYFLLASLSNQEQASAPYMPRLEITINNSQKDHESRFIPIQDLDLVLRDLHLLQRQPTKKIQLRMQASAHDSGALVRAMAPWIGANVQNLEFGDFIKAFPFKEANKEGQDRQSEILEASGIFAHMSRLSRSETLAYQLDHVEHQILDLGKSMRGPAGVLTKARQVLCLCHQTVEMKYPNLGLYGFSDVLSRMDTTLSEVAWRIVDLDTVALCNKSLELVRPIMRYQVVFAWSLLTSQDSDLPREIVVHLYLRAAHWHFLIGQHDLAWEAFLEAVFRAAPVGLGKAARVRYVFDDLCTTIEEVTGNVITIEGDFATIPIGFNRVYSDKIPRRYFLDILAYWKANSGKGHCDYTLGMFLKPWLEGEE